MLYRNRERAFDGVAMKINADDALEAAGTDQVGDQPDADRLATAGPPILTSVAEVKE
ncbi:MAG TPA: hypothetical protein VK877_15845 [Pseudolabrys sp.]|nr:hypothetical protein [Pseudolabrys sp.]